MSSVVRHIEEHRIPGKPLGRHVRHDPRSLAYLVRPRAATAKSVTWNRAIPVLDQGNLGSCTGNATVGALGTDPLYPTVADPALLNEQLAVKVYSAATKLDSYRGTYPPTDTGSDGLSAAKAAQALGLISGYLHATSLDATVTALQTGPVITGVNWYEGFDSPDSTGVVKVSGSVRGGHEFCVYGVDMSAKRLLAVNSWGPDWGRNGSFLFSFDDFDRLLHEDGDVTSFVPITQPAPTPQPGPTPDAADAALVAAGNAWEPGILSRFTKAGRFRAAFDAWKAVKGY